MILVWIHLLLLVKMSPLHRARAEMVHYSLAIIHHGEGACPCTSVCSKDLILVSLWFSSDPYPLPKYICSCVKGSAHLQLYTRLLLYQMTAMAQF